MARENENRIACTLVSLSESKSKNTGYWLKVRRRVECLRHRKRQLNERKKNGERKSEETVAFRTFIIEYIIQLTSERQTKNKRTKIPLARSAYRRRRRRRRLYHRFQLKQRERRGLAHLYIWNCWSNRRFSTSDSQLKVQNFCLFVCRIFCSSLSFFAENCTTAEMCGNLFGFDWMRQIRFWWAASSTLVFLYSCLAWKPLSVSLAGTLPLSNCIASARSQSKHFYLIRDKRIIRRTKLISF